MAEKYKAALRINEMFDAGININTKTPKRGISTKTKSKDIFFVIFFIMFGKGFYKAKNFVPKNKKLLFFVFGRNFVFFKTSMMFYFFFQKKPLREIFETMFSSQAKGRKGVCRGLRWKDF